LDGHDRLTGGNTDSISLCSEISAGSVSRRRRRRAISAVIWSSAERRSSAWATSAMRWSCSRALYSGVIAAQVEPSTDWAQRYAELQSDPSEAGA